MNYINKKEGSLTCSHPQVKKIHQWGGASLGEKLDYVTLTMLDDERKTFQEYGNGEAVRDAEQFLQSISNNDKIQFMKTQIVNCLAKYLKTQQAKKEVKKEVKFPPKQYINLLIKYAK